MNEITKYFSWCITIIRTQTTSVSYYPHCKLSPNTLPTPTANCLRPLPPTAPLKRNQVETVVDALSMYQFLGFTTIVSEISSSLDSSQPTDESIFSNPVSASPPPEPPDSAFTVPTTATAKQPKICSPDDA